MANARELDHAYRMRKLQVVSLALRYSFTGLCVLIFSTCLFLCVRVLAGEQTWVDVRFRAFASLSINRWAAIVISWILTGCTTSWAIFERLLRKKHIRRVSSEASEMQRRLDPGRRSSGLSLEGNTNEEDQ
jgi:hypothetical protein